LIEKYWEQKDMLEYLNLVLDEFKNFNFIITNNYKGKEDFHLEVNI